MAITRDIAQREMQQRAFEDFAKRIAADPDSMLHKMILIEHERRLRAEAQAQTLKAPGAILPAIEEALAVTNHYETPEPIYENPVCRGSLALGNACKICEKCLAEFKALQGFGSTVGIVSAKDPSGDTPIQTLAPKVPGAFKADVLWTDGSDITHKGLPVAGYKKEQPKWAVDLVNINKALEEAVLRQIDHLKVKYPTDVDQRQVALARTKLEEAFYHMNRAIFQPQRLLSGKESDQADAILRAVNSNAALSVEQLRERNQ